MFYCRCCDAWTYSISCPICGKKTEDSDHPEYHLYLYVPQEVVAEDPDPPSLDYTIKDVMKRIYNKTNVHTLQVCTLSTTLFKEGYRIFIHVSPDNQFEVTLGNCNRFYGRELRMGHSLMNLLLSESFDLEVKDPFGFDMMEKER